MFIGVAVGAVLKFHCEDSVNSARDVAFFTSDFGVPALQRICRCGVIRNGEGRRLPTIHGMTTGAFATIGALRELPLVRIWLVAVGALLEGNRFLEITAAVTLNAADSRVLSE